MCVFLLISCSGRGEGIWPCAMSFTHGLLSTRPKWRRGMRGRVKERIFWGGCPKCMAQSCLWLSSSNDLPQNLLPWNLKLEILDSKYMNLYSDILSLPVHLVSVFLYQLLDMHGFSKNKWMDKQFTPNESYNQKVTPKKVFRSAGWDTCIFPTLSLAKKKQ